MRTSKRTVCCMIVVLAFLILYELWPAHTVSSQIQENINSIAWKPDGTEFATGHDGGTVTIWNAATSQPRLTFDVRPGWVVYSLAWSPDGTMLAAAASLGGGIVGIFDSATGASLALFDARTLSTAVAWSPDGSLLAGGASKDLGFISEGWVRVWDVDTGQVVAELLNGGGDGSNASDISWSADGSRLACASLNWVVIWDTTTWQTVLRLEHPEFKLRDWGEERNSVSAVAWAPQGSQLATADEDTIRIWDGFSGELLFMIHNTGAFSLAWNPIGTQLASASLAVRIWDVTTGQLVQEILGYASAVAWSPDGTRLAYDGEDGNPQIVSLSTSTVTATPTPTETPTTSKT